MSPAMQGGFFYGQIQCLPGYEPAYRRRNLSCLLYTSGPTYCCEIKDGELTSYEIIPEQFGLSTYPLAELVGGTPEENAQITKDILSGTLKGAKRDVVLMNAGIGIYLGSENLTMEEGIKKAEELINSGKAYEKMEEFVKATQQ